MKTEILEVTPEMAGEWLKSNPENRPIRSRHVASLASQMKRGQWKLNGEAIKRNGSVLLDGQHRLAACVSADTPFYTLVISDLDGDIFDTLDTGAARNAADVLAIKGERNTTILSAGLKWIGRYLGRTVYTSPIFSNQDVEQLLEEHPSTREIASRVGSSPKATFIPASVMVASWYLCSLIDEKQADRFYYGLKNGEGLVKGSPVLALRNSLINNASRKERLPAAIVFALVVRAWNLYREGREIQHMRVNTTVTVSAKFPRFK